MTEQASDLVSMADIARLAGQSRSTVGNWKARDPDFPPEHSRGPRGPLYQRESVVAWLSEKGRLAEPLSARGGVFRLLDMARRDLPEDMARTFITQMAALRPHPTWSRAQTAAPRCRLRLHQAPRPPMRCSTPP